MRRLIAGMALAMLAGPAVRAQTTQGFIAGAVFDVRSGEPVAGAEVAYRNAGNGAFGTIRTGDNGRYGLPLLSPGQYTIRVTAPRYQAQEIFELELAVGSRLDLDFRLRPIGDIWETGLYGSVLLPDRQTVLPFYGPDLDWGRVLFLRVDPGKSAELSTTVSAVTTRHQLQNWPLNGRDVYAALLLMPGVTASAATARGIGVSANGQRPSSSNFLLDGIENNNYLVTGPLSTVAPEFVQEYRLSTNNFSAEYGRTSGFVANAISIAGTNDWHGQGFFFLRNEALNANGFQANLAGYRQPWKQIEPGATIGGPLVRNRVFASAAYDFFRFRSRGLPQDVTLPTASFIAATDAASTPGRLLRQFPAAVIPSGPGDSAAVRYAAPVTVNRHLALPRIDFGNGAHRVFVRAAIARYAQPDLVSNPYPDLASPYEQSSTATAAGWVWQPGASLANELRAGYTRDRFALDRAHPEVPILYANRLSLPSSQAFYDYRNAGRVWELADNVLLNHGRHAVKFGAGYLHRSLSGHQTTGSAGSYFFDSLASFAASRPSNLLLSFEGASLDRPAFDRKYAYHQASAFAEDSMRVSARLTVNAGVRYEYFGAPSNTGTNQDALVVFGSGSTLPERLAGAHRVRAGDQRLHDADGTSAAIRLGASYDLSGSGRTVLRAAYGIFYDRPFENLWVNVRANALTFGFSPLSGPVDLLASPYDIARANPPAGFSTTALPVVAYQPGLRNGRVQSGFTGIRHQLSDGLSIEVNGLFSLGRRLLTTDQVNRAYSVAPDPAANPEGRFAAALPGLSYRANQGKSNYTAGTAAIRYRAERTTVAAAYTWSHAIDNQSDPLSGDFLDVNFLANQSRPDRPYRSSFTRQFDSQGDRASADFDQRHTFVFSAITELPGRLRGWTVSAIGAVRSGLPYTVYAPGGFEYGVTEIVNARANLDSPAAARVEQEVAGGRRLLNAAAFSAPRAGEPGTTGRNAFIGPGLWNFDAALARTFAVRERARITLRAEFFNLFNHANLNNPAVLSITERDFGIAAYGRSEKATGFPLAVPLSESARQIQLLVRFQF